MISHSADTTAPLSRQIDESICMNKQRVKRLQMPSPLEHLQTFDADRLRSAILHALSMQNERNPSVTNRRFVGAMRERPWRGAARSLFIHVCGHLPMALSMIFRSMSRLTSRLVSRLMRQLTPQVFIGFLDIEPGQDQRDQKVEAHGHPQIHDMQHVHGGCGLGSSAAHIAAEG